MSRLSLLFLLAAFAASAALAQRAPAGEPATRAALTDGLTFAENRGQWPDDVLFRARLGSGDAWVTRDGVTFDFYAVERTAREAEAPETARRSGHVVAMRFEGARAGSATGHGRRATYHNYFLGDDPGRWAPRVPLYDEVVLEGLYDGVDLRLYEDEGRLRYDLVVAPGADASAVRMRMEGGGAVAVTEAGALQVATALGPVEHRGLLAYQDGARGREVVQSAFRLAADGAVAFDVRGADPARALVIDPLIWATFLGSTGDDFAEAVAVGADGSATVAGRTFSAGFPTTLGAYDTAHNGGTDVYVARLSRHGTGLEYATFLGGSGDDLARAVALGADGGITLTGDTQSADFPAFRSAFAPRHHGATDAFVARLTPNGDALAYVTFLGGQAHDYAHGVGVGADGSVTVAGWTYSEDFPTTPGAFDTSHNGEADAFVARLTPDGRTLAYATFLGGARFENALALAVGADGSATVVGSTTSAGFPTTPGAFDASFNGTTDVFVARLAPDGSGLLYATFLGGSQYETAYAVALGADGAATVAGRTFGAGFPVTPGAFDTSHNGTWDAFVTRFSPDGSALLYSTFLGGGLGEAALGVAVDAEGSATAVGHTKSQGFPTTPGAFDVTDNGSQEAFVTRLSPDGSALLYATFLGGAGHEHAYAVALSPDGTATVAGETRSADFPSSPSVFGTQYGGGYDAFVARLNPVPTFGLTAAALNSPVQRGSTLLFRTMLTNLTAEPVTAALILKVQRGGTTLISRRLTENVTYAAGQTITPMFDLEILPQTPLGNYTAIVTAVQDGTALLSTTDFPFEVTGADTPGAQPEGPAAEAFGVVTMRDDGRGAEATTASLQAPEAAVVSPNPAEGRAALAFTLAAASDVRLALYDVLGREVAVVDAGRLAAGPHRLALDVAALPAGVYVWRLQAGAHAEAGRLTVRR